MTRAFPAPSASSSSLNVAMVWDRTMPRLPERISAALPDTFCSMPRSLTVEVESLAAFHGSASRR